MRNLIATIAAIVCLPALLLAQIPRTADGKPDLSGVWQTNSNVKGTWEEANSGLGLGGTGKNPDAPRIRSSSEAPEGNPAPYKPDVAKKVQELYNRRGFDDPAARCLPPGVPRVYASALFPIQIVQTPKVVVFLYEYMNQFRIIPLNASHPDDVVSTYMGDSVGHWEGDTLVVEVVSFNDKTWLQGTGTIHSDALHVTERYTRVDKDQINYEATMDDPNVFTRPWTIRNTLMLREGTRVQEFVCAENNIDPARYEKYQKDGVNFTRH